MLIIDFLGHITLQKIIFEEKKLIFLPRQKRYQVINKCIFSSIGQKITVGESFKDAMVLLGTRGR